MKLFGFEDVLMFGLGVGVKLLLSTKSLFDTLFVLSI